jgi:hypothetical protein
MSGNWEYQIRIYLTDEAAKLARSGQQDPALGPLSRILKKHDTTMKSQYDAFADYVAKAEKNGTGNYPLYKWTKVTIENSEKKEKYLKAFTLYANGNEVYAKVIAEALERDLSPLVGGGLITKLSKHDTNPANNPQPPAHLT